jgi:hypothetical protein
MRLKCGGEAAPVAVRLSCRQVGDEARLGPRFGADGFYSRALESVIELRRPPSRVLLAPAAVVGALIVAGAAAHRPLAGGGAAPPIPAWPLLMVVGVGLVAAVAICASALWPPPRRARGLEREPMLPVRAGPLTVAIALLVPLAVVGLLVASGAQQRPRQTPSLPGLQETRPVRAVNDANGRDGADGAAALAAGVAVGLLGLAVVLALGRRGRTAGLPDHARLAVAAAAQEALAALAIPSDPRQAVLVAYARMESALADAGLQRRSSEAPREYLRRVSERLRISSRPIADLTGLFEHARFSTHAIDDSMRRAAVAALEHVAHDLKDGAS